MHIELIQQIEDLPLDRASWHSMLQDNGTNTVFQTYEWFDSWWKNYGKSHQLVFLLAYQDEQLLAFAPLMLTTHAHGQKILHFIGDMNTDYCDFVINGNHMQVIAEFVQFLYSGVVDWTSMLLLNIPDQSTTPACLQTICHEKGYNIDIKLPVSTPTLYIRGHRDEALAIVNKYSVNRHLRKLQKLGKLEFVNLHKKQDILEYIDLFFQQHIARYQLKNQPSQFADSTNREFYIDLVKNFDPSGWLLFSMLLLDGKPVACHLGFEYHDKLIWYKPAFDPAYKDFSPGILMLKHLVEYSIEAGYSELDFTVGDEFFKNRFCNRTRYNQNIAIYRSRLRLVIFMLRRYLGRIAHWLCYLFKARR
jgi:CelD/BcsL family acetyltransferase involved in cellulose biosynthesis